MTTRPTPLPLSPMPLAQFERMLDVHGADRARWPLADRAAALQLLAAHADARRMLAEAVAFEDVLARDTEAGGDAAAVARLTDRIVVAAQAGPRLATATVQPTSSDVLVLRKAAPQSEWRRAAALLAASLMIGVFVGQTQIAASAVPKLAALAGLSVSANDQVAQADLDIDAPELD